MEFTFGLAHAIVAAVALQRLGELFLSKRNGARLLAEGGREIGRGHYPVMIAIHVAWLVTLFALAPAREAIVWPLIAAYLVVQIGRIWVIHSLGRYWTTRVIDMPDAPLVRRGPYRWIKHPNYLVVTLEVAILPLAFGLWQVAALFSVLNVLILWQRLRVENAALAARRKSQ
jgi:methyltransferase